MKKFILIALLVITGTALPQIKYFIYFKDKGIERGHMLSKTSDIYKKAESMLSERCLKRRQANMEADSIITYEDLPVREDYLNRVKSLGINVQNSLKWFNAVTAYLTDEQFREVSKLSFVQKIDKVRTFSYKKNPVMNEAVQRPLGKSAKIDSLNYGYSLNQLSMSDIPDVHAKGITGNGIIIGLLDSGFDWKEQPSLVNAKVIAEHDYVFNDNITANQTGDAYDQDGHGTYVFSIIGGYDPGSFIGVAFGASYILAKTEAEGTEKHIEEDNYARALEWMESLGVDVTSSSLGYDIFDSPETSYTYADMNGNTAIVTKAAELAYKRGVVVVTSAGNEGNNQWHYISAPADGKDVIAVGAVSSSNSVAYFSSRGPTSDGRIKPDVTAMGINVYGALAHSKVLHYGSNNGTSAACPIVGGTAALLLSAYPYLKNYQAREILLESADNSEYPDNDRGYGLVSAKRAIEWPNIEAANDGFILHKALLGASGIGVSSVQAFFNDGSDAIEVAEMKSDKNGFYSVNLPVHKNGDTVRFYFIYTYNSGMKVRDSMRKNYAVEYGKLDISLNLKEYKGPSYPDDFVLGQNYPNPFNGMTRIDYKANANESADLYIINSIGQKVKYYHATARQGINYFLWDGKMEDGSQCSSGVYYYILRLSGKDYGKKMVLLK